MGLRIISFDNMDLYFVMIDQWKGQVQEKPGSLYVLEALPETQQRDRDPCLDVYTYTSHFPIRHLEGNYQKFRMRQMPLFDIIGPLFIKTYIHPLLSITHVLKVFLLKNYCS